MSDEEAKKPTSIQVNVRIPPRWLEDLRGLAKMARIQTGKFYTPQEIIRESIEFAYGPLKQRYSEQLFSWMSWMPQIKISDNISDTTDDKSG